jgi:hypothetical protein
VTLSYSRWVSDRIEETDLSGYARERAEEALQSDPALTALWEAQNAADDRQSTLRTTTAGPVPEAPKTVEALADARRACCDALTELSQTVLTEAMAETVGGHSIRLDRARNLNPCPECEEPTEGFYLGTTERRGESVVGWVCGHCETVVEESGVSETLRVADDLEPVEQALDDR